MFDAMDHLSAEMEAVADRRRKGSRLRSLMERSDRKRRLVMFAKFVFFEYLNSEKDFEEIVDEWMRLPSPPTPLP